ncbi:MAG: hypothetical protein WCS30_01425 [Selenomonadaceae bacterium]
MKIAVQKLIGKILIFIVFMVYLNTIAHPLTSSVCMSIIKTSTKQIGNEAFMNPEWVY